MNWWVKNKSENWGQCKIVARSLWISRVEQSDFLWKFVLVRLREGWWGWKIKYCILLKRKQAYLKTNNYIYKYKNFTYLNRKKFPNLEWIIALQVIPKKKKMTIFTSWYKSKHFVSVINFNPILILMVIF